MLIFAEIILFCPSRWLCKALKPHTLNPSIARIAHNRANPASLHTYTYAGSHLYSAQHDTLSYIARHIDMTQHDDTHYIPIDMEHCVHIVEVIRSLCMMIWMATLHCITAVDVFCQTLLTISTDSMQIDSIDSIRQQTICLASLDPSPRAVRRAPRITHHAHTHQARGWGQANVRTICNSIPLNQFSNFKI